MNDEKLFQARTTLYERMASRLIRALVPFSGLAPDINKLFKTTKPFVVAARAQAQQIAYRDYVKFVKTDPVPKMEQNRFTDDLWRASLEKVVEDTDVFGTDQIEELTLKADYWARDAEWGQRVDSAKRDKRIEKVARVDFKPPTCPFCTLLNSRGAVYLSADSAMRTLHTGDTCTCVFVRKGETVYPGSETTKAAKDRYDAAVKKLGTRANTTTILKELGDQDPDRPTGRVKAHVQAQTQDATASKVREAKARIAALERIQPKSESATKYRDEQLSRNKDILRALEGTSS